MRPSRTCVWITAALVSLAVLLLLPAMAQAGPADGKPAKGQTIVVGTSPDYPPFEMLENGKIIGFDIDLVTEIADRLGWKVEFESYPFDDLIPGLVKGRDRLPIDMAISAFTMVDFREEIIDFSDPYIFANEGLVVPGASTLTSWEELVAGDVVAVVDGGSGYYWAVENLGPKDVTIIQSDNPWEILARLATGEFDAVIYAIPETQWFIYDQTLDLKIVQEIRCLPADYGYDDAQYAMIFPEKGSEHLKTAVSGALQQIKGDGTYVQIYNKWFGVNPWAIP